MKRKRTPEQYQRLKETTYAWRKANPDRYNAISRKWRISNPEKVKALYRAWSIKNKEQRNSDYRTWVANNPSLKSAIRHRYRARKKAATIADCDERIKELKTCELCFWCGELMRLVTIDHVIPLSRGGEHSPDNLVAACYSCNSGKRNKLPSEWLKEAA